jgi:hypothetical protein
LKKPQRAATGFFNGLLAALATPRFRSISAVPAGAGSAFFGT